MAIIRRSDRDRGNAEWDDYDGFNLSRDAEELDGCCCPSVDVFEDNAAISLSVELPGLEKKDIKLEVEENILTISGERKFEHEDKRANYHRVERCYGDFSRSFTLGAIVDQDHILAAMDRGVLTVTLPKREESRARQIEVQVR
jgi:HSP20 family protein